MEPLWLSCLFAPLGAALRYLLAVGMARHQVRKGGREGEREGERLGMSECFLRWVY